jgi:RNA polymerase sigma-B factor
VPHVGPTSARQAPSDNLAPEARPSADARSHRRTETARLFDEAVRSEGAVREGLLEEIIRLNMVIAGELARRYHGRGIAADDLDQVANLGLVKAVQGFDPRQGNDFLSFAVPTIRGEIRRYFRDFGWAIRPPRSVQELQSRITTAEGELFQTLGRSPRPSEIAGHLGVELELVVDSLSANGCFAPMSLDAPVADGDGAPADRLGGLDPSFATAEARIVLARILGDLSPRDRQILEMRFFGGCTQAEIGAEIGVTQMQVSRLLSRLLERLRRRLETEAA